MTSDLQLHYICEIVKGIYLLHSLDIVHPYLKPENILIHQGKVCVYDLALSKDKKEQFMSNDTIQNDTFDVYEPEFMNDLKFNKSNNIFSLGMIIYQILYHELPYSNDFKMKETFPKLNNPDSKQLFLEKTMKKCLQIDQRPLIEELYQEFENFKKFKNTIKIKMRNSHILF